MKAILNQLIRHEQLSKEQARQVIINIAEGHYNTSEIASFLTVFMMRSISLEELEGFRTALLELCIHVDLSEFNAIDLCGTGGDEKNTFNISTLSAFVTAGAGVKVTKHGNYGVSSGCGSSNVLEVLGIRFSNESDFLKRCVDEAGICILHAPLFHPAMKNVAPGKKRIETQNFL
jgi:anthranilate phosphoribosyltransferase